VKRYRGRVSGPLMDRIDLLVPLPPVRAAQLTEGASGPSSAEVRARVATARDLAVARSGDCNARLNVRQLREVAALDAMSTRLLTDASDRLGLSARAIHRVMKLARTIADLDASAGVLGHHLAEAIGYRVTGA
jgi:magnesium chelatase family protein